MPMRQNRLNNKECYQGWQWKLCNDKGAINLEDVIISNIYEIISSAQKHW